MLQTVKDYIENMPSESFGTFYQRFVVQSEDKILDTIVQKTQSELSQKLESANVLIHNINSLAEELKA